MPYLIAIVVLVIVALGFTLFRSSSPTENTETVTLNSSSTAQGAVIEVPKDDSATTNTSDTNDAAPADSNSTYADGTYSSEVTYLTPIRKEYKLDVELTVKDGIVTTSNVDYSQGAELDPNPKRFEAAYKTEVVGKSLDSINLSRVGGASLTTAAFNKALIEIKADATS